jgi:holo-[acyl-carrier protein] synthase
MYHGARPGLCSYMQASQERSGVRVGTDLCSVSDVASAVERFGPRYLDRVYTPDELAYCLAAPTVAAERLAARFAAKEATIKVLRPRGGSRPDWRSIEVRRHEEGWCELALHDGASELADDARIASLAVSLSHEGDAASAVVVALTTEPTNEETGLPS